jgi:organic radical activating enzyme
MDPKKKFILFRRADHFCSAPWNLLYVDTDGGIRTCTRGHVVGHCQDKDVTDILKGQPLQDIKKGILEDQITSNCARCISLENHGDGANNYHHLRNMYNEMFVDQSVDYRDTAEFVLGAVDLHWSSVCDLKCITCWARQSSSIANEQGLPVHHTPTNTAHRLIEFITENQDSLREVYLSGGEPTLIKYNLNLLQQLEKRPDLQIRVNTNMMWSQDNRIIEEILKFPRVLFTCSADNLGTRFEYIRRGAKWNTFVDNLAYLKRFDNVEIRINSVFFVLSALDMPRVIDFFRTQYQIENFTINQCGMGHTYYQCRNLDESVKIQVRHQLEGLKTKYAHDLNLLGSLNNCIQELDRPKEECYRDKLDGVDLRARISWTQLFPELV